MLGSGSYAAALASVLERKGHQVALWCRREERALEIAAGRHSSLPELKLSPRVFPVRAGEPLSQDFDLAISVVPTQKLRGILEEHGRELPRQIPWVSASKGVELGTHKLPSQILVDHELSDAPAVLSGPSHAEEVAREVPTAVVLAHPQSGHGRQIQKWLSGEAFRVYLNNDPIGVEWGGALKNVIALASGIAIGWGFGDNTLAALITRGAVEMARLGIHLGGQGETFNGLSGIGDLIVTCFSEHSRNRHVGVRIGRGEDPQEVLAGMVQVVEGDHTSRAVWEISSSRGIEMPITEEVHLILHEEKNVQDGIQALLNRSLKEE